MQAQMRGSIKLYLKEMKSGGMDTISVTQYREEYRGLVDKATDFLVPLLLFLPIFSYQLHVV
jgi:hypothetical protein